MMDGQNSILDQNLFFLSSALSRKLSSQADAAFAKFGLSTSHVLILLLTNRNPGIQPSSLAERLHLNPSTITRLVQKLETRELLKRKSEGRATSIVCTNEGAGLVKDIEQQWIRLSAETSEELGERYVEVLSEMIFNALDNIPRK